jgi:hypothetical protein
VRYFELVHQCAGKHISEYTAHRVVVIFIKEEAVLKRDGLVSLRQHVGEDAAVFTIFIFVPKSKDGGVESR